ncbi:MAG: hypothetical protein Fur0018_07570 [Anaerolineales bacterium]
MTHPSPFTLTLWGDWSPTIGLAEARLHDPEALYGALSAVLRRADLNVLNLEGVFAPPDARPIIKDGRPLTLPQAALPALRPFRMVCLANNHIMDFGAQGLRHTLHVLAAQGIAWTGVHAPPDSPPSPPPPLPEWLHLINAAEGEEARAVDGMPGANPLHVEALCRETAQRTAQGQRVIVVLHMGREHWCFPAPYVQQAGRTLAEAGAALVVGHHPHVPQGVEVWQGTHIVYSLGNFALRPATNWRWHTLGFGLEVRFEHREAPPEVYFHPYEITPAGLRALEGEAAQAFNGETLPQLSESLQDPARLRVLWDAYVDDFLQHRGAEEISGGLAGLWGTRWGTASLWRGAANRIADTSLKGRLTRRLLRGAAALLGRAAPRVTVSPATARQAAILRNRFDTPAHRELWLRGLERLMDGTFGDSPPWALEALKQWHLP